MSSTLSSVKWEPPPSENASSPKASKAFAVQSCGNSSVAAEEREGFDGDRDNLA